jgi:hypothetical protein
MWPDLDDLLIVGDRAYAGAPHHGHVEFRRAGDEWVISKF